MKPNEIIKKYRKKAGLTQEELAKQVFVAVNTYSQYETGKRKMETEMFLTIMKVLNLEFFFEEKQQNPNQLVIDMYMQLKEKLANYSFHQHVLIHMAYRLEEVIFEEQIDERWKDYLSVHVPPRETDVYVTIAHKTIDFDYSGRVTGGGTFMHDIFPPWEVERFDVLLVYIVKAKLEIFLKRFNYPFSNKFCFRMTSAVKNNIKEIREINFNTFEIYRDFIPFIEDSMARILKGVMYTHNFDFATLDHFINLDDFINLDSYLQMESPIIKEVKMIIKDIKLKLCETSSSDKYLEIFISIQDMGAFRLHLTRQKNAINTWKPEEIMHVFKEKGLSRPYCPYCKCTYDGTSSSSRCLPLMDYFDSFMKKLREFPEVQKAFKQYGVKHIMKTPPQFKI